MSIFGLPSPIVLGLAADLLLQILLLGLLALPLGLRRLRRSADRRFPLRVTRYSALALFVCFVGALRLVGEVAPADVAAEASPCVPLEDAQSLGLQAGSVVVDPRPPSAYAAYHLDGSCRRRIDELGEVARAHPGATLYVADDTEFPQHALQRWNAEGIDARALPGGLQAFYKPNGSAFGWSPPPRSIVDASGEPVALQLGPLWFMGEQLGTRPLRQRPEAAAGTRETEVALVDLRDHGGDVPAYDAYPDRLSGPSLLLCDDPPSCLAADALGVSSPHALGKIRTLRDVETLRGFPVLPIGAFWGVLLVVFVVSFAAAMRVPRHASWFTPLLSIASALLAPRYLAGGSFVYAVDAPWLSPLFVLLLLAWLARHEAAAGKSGAALRISVALSVVFLALVELFGQGSGGLHSATALAFFASFGALLVADARHARALIRPLRFADEKAGGKAERLAKVLARGLPVPPGLVVYDAYRGELEADVARQIGAGPYVVRSSALGEDARGAATAGRYESRRDVSGASLLEAVKAVRAAYKSGAVLVQLQVEGEFAGVAEDAPLDLIRVEAAPMKSDGLLEGEGAAMTGLVSAASGWGDAPLSSDALVQCHDRVRAGAAVQSEWVASGRRLWFVQVRDVDATEAVKPAVSSIVRSLRDAWVTDPARVIFDGGALGDYDGASDATLELMRRLLGGGSWRAEAERLLGIRLPRPDPALIRLGGRLYSGCVPARPVRTALSLPWRRLRLWWLRRRRSAALERIHDALTRASRPGASLDEAAPVAIALTLLASLTDAEPALAGDPYLETLSRGEPTNADYPGRAMPDLALRLPREGRAPMPDVPPLGASFEVDLACLRGVARRLLAHHVSEYRTRPGLVLEPEPVESLPGSLTLAQLERYALDGPSGLVKRAETMGVWIGAPAPGEYVVGDTLTLVDVPTPQRMAEAAVGQLIVARRGSRLCHGALVAKERGVPALFAVGDVGWPPGCRVALRDDGTFSLSSTTPL
ncbi:MAG: hypothetical protein AB8H86_12560 [Polyangiales bacterium]